MGLTPDWQYWMLRQSCTSVITALTESADAPGFGPPAESLSLVWPRESNQREGHPDIRVWPAARPPSFRCRSGGRHEGTSLSLRSSLGVLPRVPLRNTSTRPPDGERG